MAEIKQQLKKTQPPVSRDMVFKVGGNYASGERFEAGDEVPADLSAKELEAFIALDAVEEDK